MGKFILFVGIVQLVASVVVIGLVAKTFYDEFNRKGATLPSKANAFGPVLIGILVGLSGIFGIISDRCKSACMDIFYLISATVAASASAAMVWYYGLTYYDILDVCYLESTKIPCKYDQERIDITIALLAFSSLCCLMSFIGIISSGCTSCRKLSG